MRPGGGVLERGWGAGSVPSLIVNAGGEAQKRFIEFFTANIRNTNAREAYARAVMDFFGWCERHGLGALPALEPVHVAAYVEELTRTYATPTMKPRLAAVRMVAFAGFSGDDSRRL